MYPEQNIEETSSLGTRTEQEDDLTLHPMELSYEGRITEVERIFKETMKDPGKMFEMFRIDIKATCE